MVVRDLLSNLNNILFRANIFLWSFYTMTKGFELAARQVRFDGNNYSTTGFHCILSILIFVIGWRHLTKPKTPLVYPPVTGSRAHTRISWAIRKAFRGTFRVLSATTLLFFAGFFIWGIDGYLARDLATALDVSGQYEAAERIFKLAADRDKYLSSSSVWRTTSVLESKAVMDGRTAAVATVYGIDSVEMARRYQFLGDNATLAAVDRDQEGYRLFGKARELYHKLGLHGRCSEMLIDQMLCLSVANEQEWYPLLTRAADELAKDQHIDRPWLPSIAEWFARKKGDLKLSRRFHTYDLMAQDIAGQGEPTEVQCFVMRGVLDLYIVFIAVLSGFGTRTLREFELNKLRMEASKRLSTCDDLPDYVDAQNRLVYIALYKKDFGTALSVSEQTLARLGVRTSLVVESNFLTDRQRWASVLTQEVRPLCLTLLFVAFYIT
ncbi:MAG TPA: hypothetical protein V6C81_17400 [Planktothrix sp.]|jgi:hypothetical protein